MNIILFDDPGIRGNLLPFTFTRPVAAIKTGIFTIAEKWSRAFNQSISYSTQEYLQEKFPLTITSDNLWINGAVCPDENLVKNISSLKTGEGYYIDKQILALRTHEDELPEVMPQKMMLYSEPVTLIDQVWKIFQNNGAQIRRDFATITAKRTSAPLTDEHTNAYAVDNIFLEEGVYIRSAILNAETGPIYLGKNSIVQEGAIIRGPFALGEGGHLNMGAKMRGDVSIGSFSKVGGEVSSSVVFDHTNKAHDGFLGCSVLGEWCNLGADTNTSNMKNNYADVKLWSYPEKAIVDTGVQFLGLMMGDHSKSGINTMFNTGTVVGVGCNIFGAGFPGNYVPSFSWGGAEQIETFRFDKAMETAARAMGRRQIALTDVDQKILRIIFDQEAPWRE